MKCVYIVSGKDTGTAHIFAEKKNAERYINATDPEYFTYITWELEDNHIDILTKQYVGAHILWDNDKVIEVKIDLYCHEVTTFTGMEYGHGFMCGEYWIIQYVREYRGEDMDILEKSIKAVLTAWMVKVKDMVSRGMTDEEITEAIKKERGEGEI